MRCDISRSLQAHVSYDDFWVSVTAGITGLNESWLIPEKFCGDIRGNEGIGAPWPGLSRPQPQCPAEEENTWITTTPATISPMPISAAASSVWPCQNQAMAETSTMPAPDQIA